MKEHNKIRIESFLPENGLEDKEAFFIRLASEHGRGGTDDTFKILITENFDFCCSMSRVVHGMARNFKFYFTGNVPLQIVSLLKRIDSDPFFQQLSNETTQKEYSKLGSYGGIFDILFKSTNGVDTGYLDCRRVDFLSTKNTLKAHSSIDKLRREWLSNFERQFSAWLDSLSTPYIEMLQRGIYSIEIEYD